MEMLSTLMGKYGEEGDKLLFKIQNSGDYFSGLTDEELLSRNAAKLASKIAARSTESLIGLIDRMDTQGMRTEESLIVRVAIIDELESRMTAEQDDRYTALFDDENWATTKDMSTAAMLLVAFEDVAA